MKTEKENIIRKASKRGANVDIFNLYRKGLLKFIIANPSLSEDMDYKSNSYRYKVYKEILKNLSDDDIFEQVIENFGEI